MSTIPTNRESDRFMLRLPDGMRDRIKRAAEANNRSMNAEIVARLEASFKGGMESFQVPDISHISNSMQELAQRVNEATEVYRSPEFLEAMRALAARMNKAKPSDDTPSGNDHDDIL